MSIRVPSSRGPKGLVEPHSNIGHDIISTVMDLTSKKHKDDSLNSHQSPTDQTTTNMDSSLQSEVGKSGRKSMELAVSSLAKAQQNEIQRLMNQQENDRKELKQLFEQQQRRLIQVR